MDSKQKGHLDTDDILRLLKIFENDDDHRFAEKIVKEVDIDGNGQIEFDEI